MLRKAVCVRLYYSDCVPALSAAILAAEAKRRGLAGSVGSFAGPAVGRPRGTYAANSRHRLQIAACPSQPMRRPHLKLHCGLSESVVAATPRRKQYGQGSGELVWSYENVASFPRFSRTAPAGPHLSSRRPAVYRGGAVPPTAVQIKSAEIQKALLWASASVCHSLAHAVFLKLAYQTDVKQRPALAGGGARSTPPPARGLRMLCLTPLAQVIKRFLFRLRVGGPFVRH
ncbi:hypothetical protein SKAU_G00364560 [Synaphobranchus kaupii]|uniref:Uncharacterized protein n=1 Tax=Synaphobranchus kaupii TaxID=118154 RepID=A0A9Q1EET7_SYNKA|nr:hypothetical protein SKAU_G00364560 [Synaphobranchus kaupii]